MKSSRVLGLSMVVVATLWSMASAQQGPFQYAVKFVCGEGEGRIVAPGAYFTAINVHNPTEMDIEFRGKVALALPGLQPGPVSDFFDARLGPDEAFEIDCPDIAERSEFEGALGKGFLIIQTRTELDVVAVYTAAGATGAVETMQVEQVEPRHVGTGRCPDLVVERIERPEWDGARSVIMAVIRNVGDAPATATQARLVDPSTPQPSGEPYDDIVTTPMLVPTGDVVVTFHLPYWVYNPDATLRVTADHNDMLPECNEDNNEAVFDDIG